MLLEKIEELLKEVNALTAQNAEEVVSNNVLWRTAKSPSKKQNGSKTRRLFLNNIEQPPLTS
jgi:hypothetical protein